MVTFQLFFKSGRAKNFSAPLYQQLNHVSDFYESQYMISFKSIKQANVS